MNILKVNINIGQLPWWTCWLEEKHKPYTENTCKEFFTPTLMSGLSQSLNFGRAHMFPLFQPAIQALASKQLCNICKVLLANQMRKKHPSFQESVFTDDRMACITSDFPSTLNTLLHNIHVQQHLVSTSDCADYLGTRVTKTYWILNKMVLMQLPHLTVTVAEEPPPAAAANIRMAGSLCKMKNILKINH